MWQPDDPRVDPAVEPPRRPIGVILIDATVLLLGALVIVGLAAVLTDVLQ